MPKRLVVVALALAPAFAACGSRTNLACTRELAIAKDVPSLYFVLDHSTSMKENGKWDAVRAAISSLITALGPRARFGAAAFPAEGASDGCADGAEVMALRAGDDSGLAAQAFLDATSDAPSGGTPTAATLKALIPTLSAETGPTFVVLATDGGPNCNATLACDVATCTANIDHVTDQCNAGQLPNCCSVDMAGPNDCLDGADTVTAAQAMSAAGIPVYVIGVPGSGAYAQILDAVAQAGGTARATEPLYYDVNTADEGALASALGDVARRVNASCFIAMKDPVTNPAGLEVKVAGEPTNAFAFDVKTGILTLEGAACSGAQAGGAVAIFDLDECGR